MAQRKQYIIDKKFQLKHTFSVIGFVTIITAIILGAITVSVVYNNSRIENIYEIENNIVDFLTSHQISTEDQVYTQAIKQIANNHTRNMITLKDIMKFNNILLLILLVVIVVESILLYILLIRKTHKISGPIFVMSNHMKQILNGEWPNTRPLRSKDELQEFYNLFVEVIDKFKKDNK